MALPNGEPIASRPVSGSSPRSDNRPEIRLLIVGKHQHDLVAETDDIANLAFIGGRTNRAISDKEPAKYLLPLIEKDGPELFEAQAIPIDPQLLQVNCYKEFLDVRRRKISEQLNKFATE